MKLIGINADTRELRWPIGAAYIARFRMRGADGAALALGGRALAMSIHSGSQLIDAVPGVAGSDEAGDFVTFAFAREVTDAARRRCQWEIAELFDDGKQPLIEGSVYFAPAAPALTGGMAEDASFDAVEWTAATDTVVAVSTGAPGKDGVGQLIGGVAVIVPQTAIGQTPGNVRYEMNSGGQAAFDAQMLHIAQVGANAANPAIAAIELFRFRDDAKAILTQRGKSRGDGDPNSPNFYRLTKQYDRLSIDASYGSSNHGFAHAHYHVVIADYDNDDNNEQATYQHIFSSNARSNGNGLEINSLAQVAVPGPNRNDNGPGVNFGGVFAIGPGSATMAQEHLDSGPLTTVPIAGTRGYNGRFWAVDISGRHQRVMLQEPLALTLVQMLDPSIGTATMRQGLDWVEIALTMAADYPTAGEVVARVQIAAPADGSAAPVPALVGSLKVANLLTLPYPYFVYEGRANRFSVLVGTAATLKAGATYTFTMFWRLP